MTTSLVTKKTSDDRFWLVPSPVVNLILLFLLLLKARRYQIEVHAFGFFSTHFHLVLTDTTGRLPDFMREFLSESGKALKVARGTTCRIWSGQRYSAVRLLDLDAAERKIAYVLLNPMEAGLTEPKDWPGLTSARLRFGERITARRPDVYFSEKRPASVSLSLKPLPNPFPRFDQLECESAADTLPQELESAEAPEATKPGRREDNSEARIEKMVEKRCAEIRRRLEAEGRELAGVTRVLETSFERRGSHRERDRNPRFATRDKTLLRWAIEDDRRFELEHEEAKRLYVAGHTETSFPPGTYGYRLVLGVRVARRGHSAA